MDNMKEKYRSAVTVQWVDSSSLPGWQYEEAVLDITPETIETFGFLVKETDDFIIVSCSLGTHQIDAPICIPKICINSMRINDANSRPPEIPQMEGTYEALDKLSIRGKSND